MQRILVTEVDAALAFRCERSWFDSSSADALRRWLDDSGIVLRDEGSAAFEIPLSTWRDAGKLPPKNATMEELDVWLNTQRCLERLSSIPFQTLAVESVGFVGGKGLAIDLQLNGAPLSASTSSLMAPAVDGSDTVLSPIVVEAVALARRIPSDERAVQLAALGALSDFAHRVSELAADGELPVKVTLGEHLASHSFEHVERAAPRWEVNGGSCELLLERRVEGGAYERIPVGRLHGDAPVISVSGNKHILLNDDVAEFARVAKQHRGKRTSQEAPLMADVKKLLPPGRSFECIDLTNYSGRIAGFAPVVSAERAIDIRASGVPWYRDDEFGPFLVLEIQQSDGSLSTIPFESKEEAEAFLAKAEAQPDAAIPHRQMNVVSSPPLVSKIKEALELHRRRNEPQEPELEVPDSKDGKSAPRNLAAVIKDVETAEALPDAPTLDTASVPWATLTNALQPGKELKPHQHAGIAWLWAHFQGGQSGVLLADDMGLGKTLQLLSFLVLARDAHPEEPRPSLIVAPVILLENWRAEMARFFRPELFVDTVVLHGAELRRRAKNGVLDVANLAGTNCIITNYETLAAYQQQLLTIDYDIVVLDEAQAVKNPDALKSRAARGLKRRFAVCSTGTPVENRLLDLWALYDVLSPGRPFAGRREFEKAFESDVPNGISALRSKLHVQQAGSTILRRTKAETLKDLPPKIMKLHPIAMTPEQVAQERIVMQSPGAKKIFDLLARLQKLYQHPRLLLRSEGAELASLSVDETIRESPKLGKLIAIIEEVQALKEKVIVFTLWTGMQDLLARVLRKKFDLEKVNIVNGDTNRQRRAQDLIDEFSAVDGFNVIILSPLAAGTGLTITAANHVVHYGRWWNPAKEDQASDRAYRIGQTKTVYVHHPILHHPGKPEVGFDIQLHTLVENKRKVARDFLAPATDLELSDSEIKGVLAGRAV